MAATTATATRAWGGRAVRWLRGAGLSLSTRTMSGLMCRRCRRCDWRPGRRGGVMGRPARGGPGLGSVRCSPDKPMLLISSSHEKRTAIKPRASRDREPVFVSPCGGWVNKLLLLSMNRNEEPSLPGITSVPSIPRREHLPRFSLGKELPSVHGRRPGWTAS